MGRKKAIEKCPPALRQYIFRRFREGRFPLEDLRAELAQAFPGELAPSRWVLGRMRASVEALIAHEREMASASDAMASALGEGFEAKSGAMLAQSVTTLASRAAMARIMSDEPMEVGEVLDLARVAKTAQEVRSLNLKEREEVARQAREALLAKQGKNLDAVAKSCGLSADQVAFWRRKVLGIGA
jgi:hypothetical protein